MEKEALLKILKEAVWALQKFGDLPGNQPLLDDHPEISQSAAVAGVSITTLITELEELEK